MRRAAVAATAGVATLALGPGSDVVIVGARDKSDQSCEEVIRER